MHSADPNAPTPASPPSSPPVPHVLRGVRIVSLAPNLPGPAALMRLAAMGASCLKLEPAGGDPMAHYAPAFHAALHHGVRIEPADLKRPDGQARLWRVLAESDVLVTSSRPSALARLGLDEANLRATCPHLAWVAIVGDHAPADEVPGHDLTYLADADLVDGHLPATLWSDMAGSLLAVEAVLQAVLARRAEPPAALHLRVSLGEAARYVALPRQHGLTAPGQLLGGAWPGYQVFGCADGQVALAALEPHFLARWQQLAGIDAAWPAPDQVAAGRAWCASHHAGELNALARTHDVPLLAWRCPAVSTH